jgi:hypothetical protein
MITSAAKVYNCLAVFVILGAWFLVGCEPPAPRPSALLQNTAGAPPCWHGICPGVTSRRDVLSVLESIPEVDKQSIKTNPGVDSKGTIRWSYDTSVGDSSSYLYYDGEKVVLLRFRVVQALTAGEALKLLGPPEHVFAVVTCPEAMSIGARWFYPGKGVLVTYYSDLKFQPGTLSIQENTLVDEVFYSAPADYDKIITIDQVNWGGLKYEDVQKLSSPWSGFGDIAYVDRCGP